MWHKLCHIIHFWIFENEAPDREQYNKVLHERNLASYERDDLENKYLVEQAKVMLLEKQLAQTEFETKSVQTDTVSLVSPEAATTAFEKNLQLYLKEVKHVAKG